MNIPSGMLGQRHPHQRKCRPILRIRQHIHPARPPADQKSCLSQQRLLYNRPLVTN